MAEIGEKKNTAAWICSEIILTVAGRTLDVKLPTMFKLIKIVNQAQQPCF